MANISDVAREAGVSPTTVSRTFSEPNALRQDTQKRVLEAARRLNYHPPRLRKAKAATDVAGSVSPSPLVSANAPHFVGFQFFSAGPTDNLSVNPFYDALLAGAEAEARALGLNLVINTTDRHSASHAIPRMASEQNLAGILLVGMVEPQIQTAFSRFFKEIILVDNRDPMALFESVTSDGFGGAYAVTNYLLNLRHRRIAFLTSEADVVTFQDRQRGYSCALLEGGVAFDPALIFRVHQEAMTLDEQKTRIAALLLGPEPPTAIVSANDDLALLTLDVCSDIGLRVPEDLSLAGFDDIPETHCSNPQLTTVRVEKETMGRLAMQRLSTRLNLPTDAVRTPFCVRNEVPVSLIVRQSCRPLCV